MLPVYSILEIGMKPLYVNICMCHTGGYLPYQHLYETFTLHVYAHTLCLNLTKA